jgi:hypothetical protein
MALEIAQPEARASVRANPRQPTWGPVDVVLALVMLPFGIWFFVIERVVLGVTWLFSLGSRPRVPASATAT